ncbi:MAG: hypothetical protein GY777_13530 [Candidatus Brocadiaceae bacterium]|nr:hypothetical protein [Candidatus Brocadiaceae bacterium]
MAVLLTYLYLSFGGGEIKFLDFIADGIEVAKTVIVEEDRQKEVISLLELMKGRSKEHNTQITDTDDEINNLLKNRDADLSSITAIADRDFEIIQSYSSDILDLRFKLKEHVTREEWAQIYLEE